MSRRIAQLLDRANAEGRREPPDANAVALLRRSRSLLLDSVPADRPVAWWKRQWQLLADIEDYLGARSADDVR